MKYSLYLILWVFAICKTSAQTWDKTSESAISGPNNYSLYIWDSLPIAKIKLDTFHIEDTIPSMEYSEGIIFTEKYNGKIYTYEHILKPGDTFRRFANYYRSGLSYGNFVPSVLETDTVLYSALHLVQSDGLVFEDWRRVFDHDDLCIKSYSLANEFGSAFRSVALDRKVEGDTLVISGWKVYRDALIHVTITGVCTKVPMPLEYTAPSDFSLIYSFAMRVPNNCAEFIHGLSGSAVYQKSTGELVGIQSHIGKEDFIIEGKETTYVTLIIESL